MKRNWLVLALACLATAPAVAAGPGDPTTFAAGRDAVARVKQQTDLRGRAKNVILFLGDGMGVSTVTAARIFEGQQRGETGEENGLAFETFPHVALIKTYNTDQQTPDSAGTMSAIVTGEKTRSGVLSVTRDVARTDFAGVRGNELRTILEQAEERGLATGLVTTTTITHATPAALFSHSPERDWEDDSELPPDARAAGFADHARQLVELPLGDGVDVALGGGRRHFRSAELADPEYPGTPGRRMDGRDLVAEWLAKRESSAFVWNREQLLAVDPSKTHRLLGLFEPSHLHFEFDRAADAAGEPSLSEMTAAAIAILRRNPKGFFLMVEGGRIDHGHHSGNAYRALSETVEFSNAVRVAATATDPHVTLIVVTADHSHVLTLGGSAKRGNDILGKIVPNEPEGVSEQGYALDAKGRPYTTLGYQNGPGATSAVFLAGGDPLHSSEDFGRRGEGSGRPDLTNVDTAHPAFLQEAAVPLGYETHAGEDVAAYATGPGSPLFQGVQEQHYIYHAMVEAFGWNRSDGFFRRLFD